MAYSPGLITLSSKKELLPYNPYSPGLITLSDTKEVPTFNLSNVTNPGVAAGVEPCVDELIHSSICLAIVAPLLIFIICRKNLRDKQSNQLFVNLLLVHVGFNVSVICASFVVHSNFHIYINCGFVIAMFFGLMTLSLERLLVIKFTFKCRDIDTRYVLVTILCSWLPTVLFLCFAMTYQIEQKDLMIINTALVAVATAVLIVSNIIVYRVAKKHDQFIKQNSGNNTKNQPKNLKASFVCMCIVASFVLLWLPYLVHNILALAGVYQQDAFKPFTKAVQHIALFNAIADALLFIWLSKRMKMELANVFKILQLGGRRHRGADVSVISTQFTTQSTTK